MFRVKSLKLLKALPLRKQEDGSYEMALVEDEKKVYHYLNGEWVEYNAPEGLTISLLELNSMAITQLKPLTKKEIQEAKILIKNFISKTGYYMLLSNELKYYTVFDFDSNYTNNEPKIENEIIECLNELGQLKSVDIHDADIEFWITTEEKSYPLYLFDYSGGVIKCR